MGVSFLFAWVTVSMLYLASAIFVGIVWRDHVPDRLWMALLFAGGTIFIAVNQRFIISASDVAVEAFLLAAALIIWMLTLTAVTAIVAERRAPVTGEVHE